MNLIIVESPTKARTFNRLLKGKEYFVFATMGHIRDLPAKEIAIDYQKNFQPKYVITKSKQNTVNKLKEMGKQYQQIILATDPDREGESIAYHAAYLLGFVKEKWPEFIINDKNNRLKRIVFHEITAHALNEALENPSELRVNLVKAQQARRVLDRIVGYELSPLLWKKMGMNWLSAGRVQTVALRLVVEREKEIRVFEKENYFQIYGIFNQDEKEITAKLIKKSDLAYEQIFKVQLFATEYTYTKTTINKDNIKELKNDIDSDKFKINEIKEAIVSRTPPPPLTTSLLQQEGYHKFYFSSKRTMRIAQDLYEAGLITYHRTDSFNLSTNFVFRAKDYIKEKFGEEYTLLKPRGYKTKSKLAQEAHEAIRPTKLDPSIDNKKDRRITKDHKNLYELIFRRAVATQMKEASLKQIKISILGDKGYLFEANLQQVLFDGFFKLLNPDFVKKNQNILQLKKDSPVSLKSLDPQESETKPPPRYNDASLIRTLEEKGIGRPSTYAPIISLIQDKAYVEKQSGYFTPTFLGEKICDYLSASFPNIFEINFTANMEEDLDKIAANEKELLVTLSNFYQPFSKNLEEKKLDHEKINVQEKTGEKCPECQGELLYRHSRFGKFLGCSNYPKCRYIKPVLKTLKGKVCPKCGGGIVMRFSKNKKRFFGCANYPKCNFISWQYKTI